MAALEVRGGAAAPLVQARLGPPLSWPIRARSKSGNAFPPGDGGAGQSTLSFPGAIEKPPEARRLTPGPANRRGGRPVETPGGGERRPGTANRSREPRGGRANDGGAEAGGGAPPANRTRGGGARPPLPSGAGGGGGAAIMSYSGEGGGARWRRGGPAGTGTGRRLPGGGP